MPEKKQSKHEWREALLNSLEPETMTTSEYAMCMLLGDIASSLDSTAACYRAMLKIQKERDERGRRG